jgi:TetR/AcrR family transcriptional repressor of bet genes
MSQARPLLARQAAERGYEAASISRIAKAAGLTSGLVHYHFQNKQEILLTLVSLLFERHLERLEAATGQAATPEQRLAAFLEFHLGTGQHQDARALACWVVISAEALRQPLINTALREGLDTLAACLQRIIDDGIDRMVFACGDSRAATAALLATIHGFFVLAATDGDRIPKGTAKRSTLLMASGLLHTSLPDDL